LVAPQVHVYEPVSARKGNGELRCHQSTCSRASVTRPDPIALTPNEGNDMQPLPSNFAELSELARRIDEDAEAVRTEAREKLDARRDKIRTNLGERIDRLESNLEKAQSQTSADWTALREKVKSDRERFKAKLSERKEAYKAFFADSNAEDRELGAKIAIDYAIATIQQARLAVLDAVSARAEAVADKRHTTAS